MNSFANPPMQFVQFLHPMKFWAQLLFLKLMWSTAFYLVKRHEVDLYLCKRNYLNKQKNHGFDISGRFCTNLVLARRREKEVFFKTFKLISLGYELQTLRIFQSGTTTRWKTHERWGWLSRVFIKAVVIIIVNKIYDLLGFSDFWQTTLLNKMVACPEP